jgi:stage II sporulation protein D
MRDSNIYISALIDGELISSSLADYLPMVVAAEMPALFESEALKSQAVAARTYILYCMNVTKEAHPDADVCGNASCCKAWLSDQVLRELWGTGYESNWLKINRAVYSTDGEYITYEGTAIQAVFHSSSAGRTESSGNIWRPLPYLVSVDSPESATDVPNYISEVFFPVDEFSGIFAKAYPDVLLTGQPETWFSDLSRSESGRVAYCTIAGINITGADMRRMFSLRSTAFSLEYTGDGFQFTVSGYGHGVGLSQYGANVMAKQGSSYDEILSHYYPYTQIELLS